MAWALAAWNRDEEGARSPGLEGEERAGLHGDRTFCISGLRISNAGENRAFSGTANLPYTSAI